MIISVDLFQNFLTAKGPRKILGPRAPHCLNPPLIPGFSGPEFIYCQNTPGAQGMAVNSRSGQPIYRQKNLECRCHEVLCFKIYSKFYNIYLFALCRNPGYDDSIYDCLLEGIAMAQSLDRKACFVISGDCNAKHEEWLNYNDTD